MRWEGGGREGVGEGKWEEAEEIRRGKGEAMSAMKEPLSSCVCVL